MKKLISALPLFFLLSACGQSGSLYLPQHPKPMKAQNVQKHLQKQPKKQ